MHKWHAGPTLLWPKMVADKGSRTMKLCVFSFSHGGTYTKYMSTSCNSHSFFYIFFHSTQVCDNSSSQVDYISAPRQPKALCSKCSRHECISIQIKTSMKYIFRFRHLGRSIKFIHTTRSGAPTPRLRVQ